jgi:hypothetical protein
MEDVVTLGELSLEHNLALLTVSSVMQAQILRYMCQCVGWNIFRRYLKLVQLPLDPFCCIGDISKPSPSE